MAAKRKTIFLVDDALTNLAVGRLALQGFYEVFTISSGALLLKMLERRIPDLILLDIDMPDMDGYETITAIKNNPAASSVPVIFLTSRSDADSERKGFSLGAADYIIKPFCTPFLLECIERHLSAEI